MFRIYRFREEVGHRLVSKCLIICEEIRMSIEFFDLLSVSTELIVFFEEVRRYAEFWDLSSRMASLFSKFSNDLFALPLETVQGS